VIGKNEEEKLMVRYLLGEATDEERTYVERRFLADHDYFERILALEEALVDQYATGGLAPSEQELFDKTSVSERRENVESTKELIEHIRKKNSAIKAREPSPFGMIFSRQHIVKSMLAATALLVLIAVPWGLTLSLRARVTNLQQELESKQREAQDAQLRLKEERAEQEQAERDRNEAQASVRDNQTALVLFSTLRPDRGQRSGGGELPVIEVGPYLQLLSLRLP
jgi:hypothetical protein